MSSWQPIQDYLSSTFYQSEAETKRNYKKKLAHFEVPAGQKRKPSTDTNK
jgi:hypothetical protein